MGTTKQDPNEGYHFPESTWLDIGDHDLVRLDQIAAISMSGEHDDRYLPNRLDQRVLVHTVLHLTDGSLLGCGLTWRELRNRLRKVGHEVIV